MKRRIEHFLIVGLKVVCVVHPHHMVVEYLQPAI